MQAFSCPAGRLLINKGISRLLPSSAASSATGRHVACTRPVFATGKKAIHQVSLVHFNDVYNIEAREQDPVGGAARFVSKCKQLIQVRQLWGMHFLNAQHSRVQTWRIQVHQVNMRSIVQDHSALVLFSGDSFNPSLMSTVTKGAQMPPVLNAAGVQAAVVGNHDLDFGLPRFQQLAGQCTFPWLMANLLDRRTADVFPGCKRCV